MTQWNTPGGMVAASCLDMLKQPHLLIAGATGSGKSVLINSLIYTAIYRAPPEIGLVLIDPKRVELAEWRELPHTIAYSDSDATAVATLNRCVSEMLRRYSILQAAGRKKWEGGHIYIVIDEFADLMITAKKQIEPVIFRLAQLGRAAGIHLIIATQRPTRDVVNGIIKTNIDARVALRVPQPQDSRNIIDCKGAEQLPRYGKGLYLRPEGLALVDIPMIPETETARLKNWWTN